MPLHAAFLRGINLGGRRLTMDELRRHFEAFGLDDVATYQASGNVVFDHPGEDTARLEREIEAHLEDALGFTTGTHVRPLVALERLVGNEAVEDGDKDEGVRPHVLFVRSAVDDEAAVEFRKMETPDDRFLVLGREIVWFRRGGLSDAPISYREFERILGDSDHTLRTLGTVRRIVEKFG